MLILAFVCIFILLTIAFISYLYYSRIDDSVDSISKTTSTAPSAQEEFTGATERPVLEPSSEKGEAYVSDNQGQSEIIPDKSQWTTSHSGQIIVYSPSNNQLLQKGDLISGESSLSTVSFRIIDNVSGVISEGQLTVVNGKFSGSVGFSTTATEGRLDIYSSSEDGIESSNIGIPVRFK